MSTKWADPLVPSFYKTDRSLNVLLDFSVFEIQHRSQARHGNFGIVAIVSKRDDRRDAKLPVRVVERLDENCHRPFSENRYKFSRGLLGGQGTKTQDGHISNSGIRVFFGYPQKSGDSKLQVGRLVSVVAIVAPAPEGGSVPMAYVKVRTCVQRLQLKRQSDSGESLIRGVSQLGRFSRRICNGGQMGHRALGIPATLA